jgi:hypothetical protein
MWCLFLSEIFRRNGRVSIVTCPAPNLKHMGGERNAEAQDALRHRMAKVLDLLAVAGTRTIILGAWGTGVFGHDPAAVAADWRQVLSSRFRGAFDRVIFAIIDAQTHAIFSAAFSGPPHAAARRINGGAGHDSRRRGSTKGGSTKGERGTRKRWDASRRKHAAIGDRQDMAL